MNKIKMLIIAGIVGAVIIIFIFVSLILGRTPTPSQTVIVSPTPVQFSESELSITSIIPLDTKKSYLPPQPIQISFTQEVLPTSLKYTITPQTDVLVVKGSTPNSLILAPKTMWQSGITTITILGDTTSKKGLLLKNPQSYILHTAIPTMYIPNQGAY